MAATSAIRGSKTVFRSNTTEGRCQTGIDGIANSGLGSRHPLSLRGSSSFGDSGEEYPGRLYRSTARVSLSAGILTPATEKCAASDAPAVLAIIFATRSEAGTSGSSFNSMSHSRPLRACEIFSRHEHIHLYVSNLLSRCRANVPSTASTHNSSTAAQSSLSDGTFADFPAGLSPNWPWSFIYITCLLVRSSSLASSIRPRLIRDFTVPSGIRKTSAISL